LPKKRTVSQRVGRQGEEAFSLFASRHHLLPNRPAEDVGFDFLCQVENPLGLPASIRPILGTVIGVSVRSTSTSKQQIKLSRADAETMLQAEFVVCLAVVLVRPEGETIYYRFLDKDFALELAAFLASNAKKLIIKAESCARTDTFDADLLTSLRGNQPERVRIAVASAGVRVHLPDARIEIRRNADGELTLVEIDDFYSAFRHGDPQQESLRGAIFGSPRLRFARLAAIGPRPGLTESLASLPDPVLVGGVLEAEVRLVAENASGSSRAEFTYVTGPGHWGWVHAGGFSLTISHRVMRDDQWVHESAALIDEGENLQLTDDPELWDFLEFCTADAHLFNQADPTRRFPADMFDGLNNAQFFARCLRQATTVDGWSSVDAPLSVANNDESLHTMAWVAELVTHLEVLERFGFVVSDRPLTEFDEEQVSGRIPVIGNFGQQGLVTWLEVEATLFSLNEETVRGIRIDVVHRVDIEVGDRFVKESTFPELVVAPSWPTVSVSGHGTKQTETDAGEWDLGFQLSGDSTE
jgi:hypothetical protein